jgi:hypothetical protein
MFHSAAVVREFDVYGTARPSSPLGGVTNPVIPCFCGSLPVATVDQMTGE